RPRRVGLVTVFTARVNAWVAVPNALVARKVRRNAPLLVTGGVPDSTPVLALKVTPGGRVPVIDSVGLGVPVAVTVKVPALPAVKVVVLALVMAGAWFTVRVKLCDAGVPMPLLAIIVRA